MADIPTAGMATMNVAASALRAQQQRMRASQSIACAGDNRHTAVVTQFICHDLNLYELKTS